MTPHEDVKLIDCTLRARSPWYERDVIWFLGEQLDIFHPWEHGHRCWDQRLWGGGGGGHMAFVERAQLSWQLQWNWSTRLCISAPVPTLDPLTVDQYLISPVSFVFLLNNPHSQKKTSDALANLHLSKVTVELLMQTVDKFMKKCAWSHPIH